VSARASGREAGRVVHGAADVACWLIVWAGRARAPNQHCGSTARRHTAVRCAAHHTCVTHTHTYTRLSAVVMPCAGMTRAGCAATWRSSARSPSCSRAASVKTSRTAWQRTTAGARRPRRCARSAGVRSVAVILVLGPRCGSRAWRAVCCCASRLQTRAARCVLEPLVATSTPPPPPTHTPTHPPHTPNAHAHAHTHTHTHTH
jgi:hypothetical protein